jgi:hypothetical protein
MRDILPRRERYMRDDLAIRLGGLAANLRRMRSFAAHPRGEDAVASLVEESKYFIEWTAFDAPPETAAQLVHLQVELARWQLNWAQRWSDSSQRQQLGEQALAWSDRVLRLSGLLASHGVIGERRPEP